MQMQLPVDWAAQSESQKVRDDKKLVKRCRRCVLFEWRVSLQLPANISRADGHRVLGPGLLDTYMMYGQTGRVRPVHFVAFL